MKKIFCLFLIGFIFLTCKGNTPHNPQSKIEEEEDIDINVTFKVYGNFGYLIAKYKERTQKTASTDAITVKKNGIVSFLAEPMDGFEVKTWKIENGEFTEGGLPKNKNAKVVAREDLTVTVEFIAIQKPEEPANPFTIQSLNIGKKEHLKLTEEQYKETMNKIKNGDATQNLESIAQTVEVSIWTKEDIKEVYINDQKYSPDLGEPHFFKGSIEAPEAKTKYKITLKGEKLKSVLIFSLKKVEGKVAFPESEMKLFINGKEVSTHIYSHLSDTDESTYPLIESKKETREIKLKASKALFAGKVIYEGTDYPFSEDLLEAVFTISDISENTKTIDMEIVPKSEENYNNLKWHFKIVKIKDINPVTAFLYIDNELAPQEISDALLEDSPATFIANAESVLISVRTGKAHEIEKVIIDGKEATFKNKKQGLKYCFESSVENINETAREIVIVITPKEGKGLDITTWKFNIKK